jgi:hypothetical protein
MKTTIIIILIILIIIMLALVRIININAAPSEGILTIISPQEDVLIIYNLPDAAFKNVNMPKGDTLKLLPVEQLLLDYIADESWQDIVFSSRDGGSVSIPRNELENLYFSVNKSESGDWLRLIIPADRFHQRWLKYIISFKLK